MRSYFHYMRSFITIKYYYLIQFLLYSFHVRNMLITFLHTRVINLFIFLQVWLATSSLRKPMNYLFLLHEVFSY